METSHPTELCLEFTSGNTPEDKLRRQVTEICVSHLGLSTSDAERVFERGSSFLVSPMRPEVDLASLISNLEPLGVLVRPSSAVNQDHMKSGLHSARRRAALYSSQYGDLLGVRDTQPTFNPSSTQPQQKQRIPSRRLALLVTALLLSIGIPSSRYWSTKSEGTNWNMDDFRPTSWSDSPMIMSPSEEAPGAFRGSASLTGVRILGHVSRNGNTYSARFTAHTSYETPSPLRIEGEPVFLAARGNKYSGTTTYTITDSSGAMSTGSAQINVTLNTDGVPEQAQFTLDLPDGFTRLSSPTYKRVTFSIGLLPG